MSEQIQTQDQNQEQNQEQNQVQETGQVSSFRIPDEYQDRGWAGKITSQEELFKSYDNAQSLIGKRPAGIPTQDASDDDWDKFYKAMGRPDEAKYDFSLPEGFDSEVDISDFNQKASEIFHRAGLTPKQAQEIYNSYLNLELDAKNKSSEAEAELDKEFDTLTKEHFGDDYERYRDLTISSFEKYSPQSLKESIASLSDNPKALAAVVATVKGLSGEIERVKKEYGAEGDLHRGNQVASASIDDVRKELAKLRISSVAKDFTHPDHNKTVERINHLSDEVNRFYNKN